jgi:uncharacterized protein YegL
MEQNPFLQQAVEQKFADNPEPRCASLLILDVSGSMQGSPLCQLQAGLEVYRDSLHSDPLARARVEVAILTFGGKVEIAHPFATVDLFTPPTLEARGDTPMGQAVLEGLEYLGSQKALYKNAGIAYYRPWVFLLTDGGPTDVNSHYWAEAKRLVKDGESSKTFSFFAVGVEGADMGRLAELSVRKPLQLKGLEFRKMFEWLSSSQQAASRSTPGDAVKLEAPSGWAEI